MGRRTRDEFAELNRHAGQVLRSLRQDRGLTQPDLAVKSGVSFQQLHKYEIGMNAISLGRARMLADALGVTPAVLIGNLLGEQEAK